MTATVATSDLLDRAATIARESARDSDERWAAVTALRDRPERSVFERAAAWCASSVAAHQALGADVLAQLGTPDCPFADASTPILERLLRDQDDAVVSAALSALGHLRVGAPPEIAAFARHAASRVREATAFALGGRDEPAALDALRLLTTDVEADIRNWATFALGSLCEGDSAEIRDALAARLTESDAEIRGEALVGLARRHDERAIAGILAELARDDVSVLAFEAAELMPSRQFVPALRALPDSGKDDAIQRALHAATRASQ